MCLVPACGSPHTGQMRKPQPTEIKAWASLWVLARQGVGLATPGLKDLAQLTRSPTLPLSFLPFMVTEHLLKTSLLQEVFLNYQRNFLSALAHLDVAFLGYSPSSVFTQSASSPNLSSLAGVQYF